MRYTPLGKNGPEVSVIGYGAWGISGKDWGTTDDQVSLKAIHTALDEGVNFIDTADVYGFGHSDELIKKVIRDRKQPDIVLATKAGSDFYSKKNENGEPVIQPNYKKEYLVDAVEKSLERLEIECLDILQLHSPSTEVLSTDEPWDALYQLKKDGKIKRAGISIASFKETEQTPFVEENAELIDVLQVRYNILERQAEERLFPAALKNGIGIIARIPLLFGFLTGKYTTDARFGENDHRRINLSPEKLEKYTRQRDELKEWYDRFPGYSQAQISLAAAIAHPAVAVAIPGGKTPRQVIENCKAAEIAPERFSSFFQK